MERGEVVGARREWRNLRRHAPPPPRHARRRRACSEASHVRTPSCTVNLFCSLRQCNSCSKCGSSLAVRKLGSSGSLQAKFMSAALVDRRRRRRQSYAPPTMASMRAATSSVSLGSTCGAAQRFEAFLVPALATCMASAPGLDPWLQHSAGTKPASPLHSPAAPPGCPPAVTPWWRPGSSRAGACGAKGLNECTHRPGTAGAAPAACLGQPPLRAVQAAGTPEAPKPL